MSINAYHYHQLLDHHNYIRQLNKVMHRMEFRHIRVQTSRFDLF